MRKGKHHTKEANKKNRQAHLGKPGYWLGKKRPDIAQKQKIFLTGKRSNQSNHWKGGISRNYFKRTICIRDNYTCQICGLRDVEIIEVDHIKPKALAPELFSELTNLICICPNCHRRKTNRDLKIIKDSKR